MPFIPDSPPMGKIPQPDANQVLDTFHIHGLDIKVHPNDSTLTEVMVHWSKGYMDAGEYKGVEFYKHLLKGTNLINKIGEATSGDTIYNEVKKGVWELMETEGIVPSGTSS